MTYAVLLESRVERQVRNLPQNVRTRIDALLETLSGNPRPRGVTRLSGRESEGWRVRIGEYRVLYTIDDDARAVRVYRIAHRREAYR